MPARTPVLLRRRSGDAHRRHAQAGRRGDHGRDLLRNRAAHRGAGLRRVQRSHSRAEAGARAHCAAGLGDVATVGIWMAVDAIVIGAGCAGFAAATALAESGARVLVLEARPGLGGRATAFTDPETGERVDNGQHILMGCYVETLAFLDRIGAADRVSWQSGLRLSMIDRRGHHSVRALPALPSPLHFLAGILAWEALTWGERLSVLIVGSLIRRSDSASAFAFAGSPLVRNKSGVSVRAWLE